ncbi:hypothetical protein [Streptomyces longispororuber]|uniref:hypothetical protein n=1 Tax=Streptomyces longispororuber TaxID=68230 RepID=UPI00210DB300|nr:hypothetical protein [Streptomyces longispororuber]MCQ4205760.1 hypothetical protein [Streptomyces longispororuber]
MGVDLDGEFVGVAVVAEVRVDPQVTVLAGRAAALHGDAGVTPGDRGVVQGGAGRTAGGQVAQGVVAAQVGQLLLTARLRKQEEGAVWKSARASTISVKDLTRTS